MASGSGTGPAFPGHQQRSRRGRLWMWLAIVGGGAITAVVAVVVAGAGPPASSHRPPSGPLFSPPSLGTPPASPPPTSAPITGAALGPSACTAPGGTAAGRGPWKLLSPRALCGLPLFDSAQYVQSGQSLASIDKLVLSMDNIGPVTATVSLIYQSPKTPNFYRSIAFVGFEGRFRPPAALGAMEQPGYTYTSEPPGPHAGLMACTKTVGPWDCVWATPTTVCDIEILDTTGELTGAGIGANAVRIRGVLEAPR